MSMSKMGRILIIGLNEVIHVRSIKQNTAHGRHSRGQPLLMSLFCPVEQGLSYKGPCIHPAEGSGIHSKSTRHQRERITLYEKDCLKTRQVSNLG